VTHLWLDATGLEEFAARFPTLSASLAAAGLDPAADWLPIAPAAHHLAGGVLTDLDGATAMPGLFAVGEVACTGVHGANRLASNSLLEGMVFAARVAEALEQRRDGARPSGAMRGLLGETGGVPALVEASALVAASDTTSSLGVGAARHALQRAMTRGAGVVRTFESLHGVRAAVAAAKSVARADEAAPGAAELANLATCAEALLTSATLRTESRGCHVREEYPAPDAAWRRRVVLVGAR